MSYYKGFQTDGLEEVRGSQNPACHVVFATYVFESCSGFKRKMPKT